jgi:hypothetical protein
MKKTVFRCLGAAAVAFALQFTPASTQAAFFDRFCGPCDEVACNPCDEIACDPCGALNGCGPQAGKWFLNGHMEAGFFANAHGATNIYGGSGSRTLTSSGNSDWLMNTKHTGAQINQVYISAGRSVDGRRGLDIGGTVDFTWGSDAWIVQAAGMEHSTGHWDASLDGGRWGTGDYYSAFAQAYAEIAYGRWNVKAGKMHLPFGIDSYKSTDNFLYTWSPTSEVVPHVGTAVLTTYTLNNRLSVFGGWGQADQIGETSNDNAVLGGFNFQVNKRHNLRYAFAVGENKYQPVMIMVGDKEKYFVQSLGVTSKIGKRLTNTFDWSYHTRTGKFGGGAENSAYTYALMNELVYCVNKRWAFGTRFGVLGGGDAGNDLFNVAGVDLYTVSLGANWTPNQWLTVKPEVRYDWTDEKAALFNTGTNSYQLSGGMSAVVKF